MLPLADAVQGLFNRTPVDQQLLMALQNSPPSNGYLEIVSYCPTCKAPIYGPRAIKVGEMAEVHHSCNCHPAIRSKTLQELMLTK